MIKPFGMQVMIAICACAALASGVEIYVSPAGSDTAAGTPAAPLATIAAARDKADGLKTGGPVTVYLRGGTYYFTAPVVFGPSNSGSASAPITYTAYTGEKPMLSGGIKIIGSWTTYSGQIMQTTIASNLSIDQLFLNGKRQVLARYPNFDSTKILDGYAADCISATRAARWANVTEGPGYVRGINGSLWGGEDFIITGKDGSGAPQLKWVGDNNRGSGLHGTYRMVENIFEELDAPGEWYYQKSTGKLFFYPPAGADLTTATIEAASAEELIKVVGSATSKVRYLAFNGLTFTQTHRTLFTGTYEELLRGDWCIVREGTVYLQDAENITVQNCVFDQVGGNAIFISGYNKNHLIYNNSFSCSGATNVAVVGLPSAVRTPSYWENQINTIQDNTQGPKTTDYPTLITISNNSMYKMGRFEKQTCGVCFSMAYKISILHNSISYSPRAGINANDGTWGGHIIAYNDISHCVQETGDHGPFNSWGRDRFWSVPNPTTPMAFLDAMTTTQIYNNRVQDNNNLGYYGIDLDDGSSNYWIYKNLCLNCGIKCREGFGRKVYNNVIVNGQQHCHVWFPGSKDSIYNNIIINANSYDIVSTNFSSAQSYIDKNLFWNNGGAVAIATQSSGLDAHSVTADPKFTNASDGNYSVQPGSPALSLGFVNFPMDSFGRMPVSDNTPVLEPFKANGREPFGLKPLLVKYYAGRLMVSCYGDYNVAIMSASGRILAAFNGKGRSVFSLEARKIGCGMYFAIVKTQSDLASCRFVAER